MAEIAGLEVATKTEQSDVERQRKKADADVEQVRQRASRDQQRLDAGQVSSPRDLENLQHEIASLQKRQADLEDIELEIMERLEGLENRVVELGSRRTQLQRERDDAVSRRDAAVTEIDADAADSAQQRQTAAADIDPALIALYEKVREQHGGIGAAALLQRRCQGCRLELNTTELNGFRLADADEVLRCEECGRILVRTPESGL